MKIKDLISTLELYKNKYGNINVVLSVDPEGNSYSTIDSKYSFCCVRDGEDMIYDKAYKTTKGNRINFNDYVDTELKKHKVIGVCIYPFDEGFSTPESAIKES